tara:strand:- start:10811 stop:14668 length:3858 start_codon:yes stop_codon:yes gene_type:complete
MSATTQKIPNLLAGISQQPDSKKLAGQVRDSVNTLPEYALGLMKRPGGMWECSLPGAKDNGAWFEIIKDGEKYVGQINMEGTHPDIRIWLMESGIPRIVDYNSLYNTTAKQVLVPWTWFTNNDTNSGDPAADGERPKTNNLYDYRLTITDKKLNKIQYEVNQYTYNDIPGQLRLNGHTQNADAWYGYPESLLLSFIRSPGLATDDRLDEYNALPFTVHAKQEITTPYLGEEYTFTQEVDNSSEWIYYPTDFSDTPGPEDFKIRYYAFTDTDLDTVQYKFSKLYMVLRFKESEFEKYDWARSPITFERKKHGTDDWVEWKAGDTGYAGKTLPAHLIEDYTYVHDNNDYSAYKAFTNTVQEIKDVQDAKKEYDNQLVTFLEQRKSIETTVNRWFEIETTYNQGDIYQFVKNGVIENPDQTLTWIRDEDHLPQDPKWRLGADRTSEYPLVMEELGKDHKLYELVEEIPGDGVLDDFSDIDKYDENNDLVETPGYLLRVKREAWAAAVKVYNEKLLSIRNTTHPVDYASLPADQDNFNNYFVSDIPGENFDPQKHLHLFSVQDSTFILNKAKAVKWKPGEYNQTSDTPNEAYVNFLILQDGYYTVKITLKVPEENNPDVLNDRVATLIAEYNITNSTTLKLSDVLLGSINAAAGDAWDDLPSTTIKNSANADVESRGFRWQAVGTGIYLQHEYAFDIEVSGPIDNSITVFRREVITIGDLPLQAKNGYKVKVVNTADTSQDNMWVEYRTEDPSEEFGLGAWQESNQPGWDYVIDPRTMPHVLQRQADGSYTFGPWDKWEDRRVGDEETNKAPSFISGDNLKFVQDMFLFRNRLGFLCNDSVILSRAGDYFNFFNKSALAVGSDDPIDVAVSVDKPVKLQYVHADTAGLLLFGESQQFLLTTDSDLLSPITAKVNSLTGFSSAKDLRAMSLGGTSAFFSKTEKSTKFFELVQLNSLEAPDYVEQTKLVPELLPETIDSVVVSSTASTLTFIEKGTNIAYLYTFLKVGNKEVTKSWYRWELPGNIVHQFFDASLYKTVTRDSTGLYHLHSYDYSSSNLDGVLALPNGQYTDLRLDNWVRNPYSVYNSSKDCTRYELPTGTYTENTGRLTIVLFAGEAENAESPIFYPQAYRYGDTSNGIDTDEFTDESWYLDIPGDWRGYQAVIGYTYDMRVELPKFYSRNEDGQGENTKADTSANLIIHRLKVKCGVSGPVDYEVKILGRDTYTTSVTFTPAGQYQLNTVNVTDSSEHTVPIYQRNDNVSVAIIGSTPFPVTLESLNWEGRLNSNFYARL